MIGLAEALVILKFLSVSACALVLVLILLIILAWSLNFEASQEDLGPKIINSGAGIVWRPNDRFSLIWG